VKLQMSGLPGMRLLPSGEVTSWNPSFYSPKHHDHAVPDELKEAELLNNFLLWSVLKQQGYQKIVVAAWRREAPKTRLKRRSLQ